MRHPSPFMRVTALLLSFCAAHAAETTAQSSHPAREGMLANPRTALFWEGSDHSDGSFQERPAGTVDYHGVHGHYHYSSFANALLWRSDSRGERIGNAPVAASHKVSFRMADIRIEAWGEKRVQVLGVLKK